MSPASTPANYGKRGRTGCPEHGLEHLRVMVRRANFSAFNGYRRASSDYSQVACFAPGDEHFHRTFRTKAAYVDDLPDGVPSFNTGVSVGHTW